MPCHARSTSAGVAAARSAVVGKRSRNRAQASTTRETWVCWAITSDTRIAYGSRVPRQGRSRPCSANQASSSSSTVVRLGVALDELERSRPGVVRGGLVVLLLAVEEGVRRALVRDD